MHKGLRFHSENMARAGFTMRGICTNRMRLYPQLYPQAMGRLSSRLGAWPIRGSWQHDRTIHKSRESDYFIPQQLRERVATFRRQPPELAALSTHGNGKSIRDEPIKRPMDSSFR